MAATLLRARTTFAATVKGTEYSIRAGEVVQANHPVVKGRESLFELAQPTGPAEKRTH